MTLRARLLLVLVGVLGLGMVVADVVTYTSLRSFLVSRVDQELTSDAGPVFQYLRGQLAQGNVVLPGQGGSDGVAVPPGTFGAILDASGTVRIQTPFGENLPAPQLPGDLPGSGGPASGTTLFDVAGSGNPTVQFRVLAASLVDRLSGNPVGTLVVALPLGPVGQTLARLLLVEVLVTAGVLVALGFGAWYLVRRELRPLDAMAASARAIAAGDLSRRVPEDDPGTEVGQLGQALNTMLGEIERSFIEKTASEQRLRRFLADASHELRTPLTAIRGFAELFDRGARRRPEDLEVVMHQIRAEAERMGLLVEDLLLLARLEQPRPLEHAAVDLVRLAAVAVAAAQPAYPDHPIELDAPVPVTIVGDPDRLRQVVDNLLVNACRHTPPATSVVVRVAASPHTAMLAVEDRGPGIAPELRGDIFLPFHRADPSRSRASGGAGLGLSIVSAIVRAHHGTVTVDDAPGGGARFTVTLPANDVRAVASAPEVWPSAAAGSESTEHDGPGVNHVRSERGGVPPMSDDQSTGARDAALANGRPGPETASEDERESRVAPGADRGPTQDEQLIADRLADRGSDPDIAEHERDMARRGVDAPGEGRIE